MFVRLSVLRFLLNNHCGIKSAIYSYDCISDKLSK